MGIEEWARSLTDEQKASLKGCETADEVAAFCKESGIGLPDELLDGVAGGVGNNLVSNGGGWWSHVFR
jgi:hypothetical protein